MLNAANGMGMIKLQVPENKRYTAALESFKQDEALQAYYISRKVEPSDELVHSRTNFSGVFASDFALLNYDAAMAVGFAACEVKKDFFSASDLFEMIAQLEFVGATGQVVFNNETGTKLETNVRYTLHNLLASTDSANEDIIHLQSIESAVISLNASNEAVEIVYPFVYSDNTTNQPPALPPYDMNMNLIPTWALVLGLSFCGIMMLLSIWWAAWSIQNRKHPMVRASQPFFLIMLCFGTFLIASSIVPTSFQEPMGDITLNFSCMLFSWLFYVGFVTAFSALFTKNGRINAIYHSARACRRVTIKPKDVILPFLILLALHVTLLMLWTALAPWKWKRVKGTGEDQFGRATDTYGDCVSSNVALFRTFSILLAIINVVPIILANYQSYRCWNLPTEFNESRYLAISMASILEAFLIGLPLILVAEKSTAVFLSRAVILCVVCLSILLPMFVPKWLHRKYPVRPSRKLSIISNASAATNNGMSNTFH